MTDDETHEESGPDGVVVIHHPSNGDPAYGVGPFPPVAELVDWVIENGPCDCRKEALPIIFPAGISMAVDVTGMAVAMARLFTEEPSKDRLN